MGDESTSGKLAAGTVVSMQRDRKGISAALAELVTRRKALGVYLTTRESYRVLSESLRKDGIDVSSLFFLDVGKGSSQDEDNVFCLRDPADLTELSVVITELLDNERISFLLFDSVSGLESYVEPASVKKFLHMLVAYMKKVNKLLIIDYEKEENKDMVSFINQISS